VKKKSSCEPKRASSGAGKFIYKFRKNNKNASEYADRCLVETLLHFGGQTE